jgi:hypothetical protein
MGSFGGGQVPVTASESSGLSSAGGGTITTGQVARRLQAWPTDPSALRSKLWVPWRPGTSSPT